MAWGLMRTSCTRWPRGTMRWQSSAARRDHCSAQQSTTLRRLCSRRSRRSRQQLHVNNVPQPTAIVWERVSAGAIERAAAPHELARKLAGGEVQLVDVREPHEVARGKCVGSVCFPLSEMRADEPKPPDALDRSRPIYLHCGRGVRVHPAKELLSGMGFDADKLHPLAEGYDALAIFGRTAGYAVLRSNLDPATPVQPAQPTQPPAAAQQCVPQPQPSSGSGSAPAPSSEQPHLHELARKLAGGEVQLVDVREPHEVARGKCVGSVCFPLSEMRADEPKPPDALDRSRPIYLHCGRGVRVHPAKELLSGMGFDADKLHPLAEGYDALAIFGRTAGYAVLRSNLDALTPSLKALQLPTKAYSAVAANAEKARTWLPLVLDPPRRSISASSVGSLSDATFSCNGSSDRLVETSVDTAAACMQLRTQRLLAGSIQYADLVLQGRPGDWLASYERGLHREVRPAEAFWLRRGRWRYEADE